MFEPDCGARQSSAGMDNLLKLWRDNQQLRYLVVGGWNTVVGYGLFASIYLIVGKQIGYLAVAIIGHVLAVSHSFLTQRHLVFRHHADGWQAYLRFHIAHLGTLLLGTALLSILVEMVGLKALTAQALVTVVTVCTSYFLHRNYSFKND
jgi:putative flippase GtrA